MSSKVNPKVYMDIQIGSKGIGRMIFELFLDFTPKTAQNFRGICAGEYNKKDTGSKLHYLNSKIHKVVAGSAIYGGDITNGNGTGGYSIYGRTFEDQNFDRKHSCAGVLSMVSNGRNTNSSQFAITLKEETSFDNKFVVFGHLVDGIEVLRQIAKVAVDKKYTPRVPIIIIGCGQVGDFKNFLTFDPFQKSAEQRIRAKRESIIRDQHLMRKLISEGVDPNEAYNYKRKLQKCQRDLTEVDKMQKLLQLEQQERRNQQALENIQEQEQEQANISSKLKQRLGHHVDRFLDLKLKLNEAKVQNSKAAAEQEMRENDMHYKKMLKKKQYQERRQKLDKELEAKGLGKDHLYMNRNSLKKQRQAKDDQSFGWNVFGEDAYYKAYDRRCQKLSFDPEKYKKQLEDPNFVVKPTEQALNYLVTDLQKQEEKRNEFSRRRAFDEDQKVTSINDRNRVFNKKLQRSYGQYTAKIKTAMQMMNNTK